MSIPDFSAFTHAPEGLAFASGAFLPRSHLPEVEASLVTSRLVPSRRMRAAIDRTFMSAYALRNATEADLPAITAIYSHAVIHGTASYELMPPDEAEMARRLAALTSDGYPYIVAEDGSGTLLGYAYAGPFRARPAYRWSVEDSVYLLPEAQGYGVGRALLLRLVELCEEKGFRQMIAVVGGSDHAPSIRLHEKAGFRTIGIFQNSGFKHGRWIDTVFMQLPLGESGTTLPDEGDYPGTLYQG